MTAPVTAAALRSGQGELPCLSLACPDGARAQVYLHGAQLTSWRPAGETEDRLFLSAASRFAPRCAIRGGVPICFPQFADQGPLRPHGFARLSEWRLLGNPAADCPVAQLGLDSSAATLAEWPHSFRLELRIEIGGPTLSLALCVENTGVAPISFTAALHTYLRVREVSAVAIRGLAGTRYRDKVRGGAEYLETGAQLAITGETDRVYYAAPDRLLVEEPGRQLAVHASGFPDTVIWNPGSQRAAALGDMEPDGERHMLCVEAAAARTPVVIGPGERWRGTQTLTAG